MAAVQAMERPLPFPRGGMEPTSPCVVPCRSLSELLDTMAGPTVMGLPTDMDRCSYIETHMRRGDARELPTWRVQHMARHTFVGPVAEEDVGRGEHEKALGVSTNSLPYGVLVGYAMEVGIY